MRTKNTRPTQENGYLYGIQGIADFFHVSKPTAQMYKKTFLKPGIIQRGQTIMIEQARAVELFKNSNC